MRLSKHSGIQTWIGFKVWLQWIENPWWRVRVVRFDISLLNSSKQSYEITVVCNQQKSEVDESKVLQKG